MTDRSLEYLVAGLAGLRARVHAAVTARRATDPGGDERFKGLYIGDDEAATGEAQLKSLRAEGGEQKKLKVDDLAEAIIGQLIDTDEEE